MKEKKFLAIVLALGFMSLIFFAVTSNEAIGQESKEKKLSQKYLEFLRESRDIMLPEEKEVFMKLTTDEERDVFIEPFWKQRGLGRRRTRENITTLWLLRMTRVLDLTEEQTAKIFPVVTRIEKEKMEVNQRIRKLMREIRLILNDKDPDQKELKNKIDSIKELRSYLKNKDEELENFLEENLTLIQRAKYLMFAVSFYRDLRQQLERAKIMREKIRQKNKKRF